MFELVSNVVELDENVVADRIDDLLGISDRTDYIEAVGDAFDDMFNE